MAKRERTNNNLQNTTQKTKYRSTQTPLKPGVNSGALDEIQIHAPIYSTSKVGRKGHSVSLAVNHWFRGVETTFSCTTFIMMSAFCPLIKKNIEILSNVVFFLFYLLFLCRCDEINRLFFLR